ncbi:hypothetical protein CLOSTASPAR_02924 [[Clostridium] asparagiforme DSM 15981]|uniref:Uncharacterized protein n=1 Tax=[Clostridium] asparagiforme DSM 15981 TaxID=518636 RepID=C0D0Y6_9FIRM|nr:hypothetical protein CLOSTASPAR_02924 [[Clostridium] asparagiforme DSM 15981]
MPQIRLPTPFDSKKMGPGNAGPAATIISDTTSFCKQRIHQFPNPKSGFPNAPKIRSPPSAPYSRAN